MRAHAISANGPAGRKILRDAQHDSRRDCGRGQWCATDGDWQHDRPTTWSRCRAAATPLSQNMGSTSGFPTIRPILSGPR